MSRRWIKGAVSKDLEKEHGDKIIATITAAQFTCPWSVSTSGVYVARGNKLAVAILNKEHQRLSCEQRLLCANGCILKTRK